MAKQNSEQPVSLYLSIVTLPVMGLLVAAKTLQEVVVSVGLASEEIFRGDRLPLLKKPRSPLPPDL
jgi:hypothetical protein